MEKYKISRQFGNSIAICYNELTKDCKLNMLLSNRSIFYKDHVDLTSVEKNSTRDFYFNCVNRHLYLH